MDKKGSNGLIGVIGGCLEYTGAPYYAGISAIKTGADMARVFCHTEAAVPIKSYSPELMVKPAFNDPKDTVLLDSTARWFKTTDCLIVGCGLGREGDEIKANFNYLIGKSCVLDNLYHIFDADGLHLLLECNSSFKEYSCVLTPNHKEFSKIYQAETKKEVAQSNLYEEKLTSLYKSIDIISGDTLSDLAYVKETQELAKAKKQFVLRKGIIDCISDGTSVYLVCNEGSAKRAGGQGDILAGTVSSCLCYAKKNGEDPISALILASFVVREASRIGFEQSKIGFSAPDSIEQLSSVVNKLIF